jgi:N-acyl-D-amino-acid deacylase
MRDWKAVLCILVVLLSTTVNGQRRCYDYDCIIWNGLIYDGSGNTALRADLAISADTIAAIGNLHGKAGTREIDAHGMAVTPGFVNMLSWGCESLLVEGLAMSDITQGVTLNIFGEGWSMGPLNDAMRKEANILGQPSYRYQVNWRTLGEYLNFLESRGVSTNIASFIGAATVRINVVGNDDRRPTPEELSRMCGLVRQAMEEGALGVGSSLIYAPAFYAKTDELVALCRVASDYGGIYISHMRSEGNAIESAIDELIDISTQARIPAEIYHWKVGGKQNWNKVDRVIAKVDSARATGAKITADMYTYEAGGTGMFACMPPWVQEGGQDKWIERLKDREIRRKVAAEMRQDRDDWENFFFSAGPQGVVISGVQQDSLRKYIGKNLADLANLWNTSPEEAAMDIVVKDNSGVSITVFLMTEKNIRKQLAKPYVSIGSDAESISNTGVFVENSCHPRTYGCFTRVFSKYVREKLFTVEEAVRRMTSLPCENLHIMKRGSLKVGYYADVNVFNPAMMEDHATYKEPHQYSTGMVHVFVNGIQVLKDGRHTGAMPGRFVKGPGYALKQEVPRRVGKP